MAGNLKPINFIFTIHYHQPVGVSDSVFNEAYINSYLPFIETFEKYPMIKFTAHYSGNILEWAEKNRPEFLEKIKLLVRRGQLEILTGGFYEPILPIVSHSDGIEQINLATNFIKKNFLRVPSGLWLTEGIWEPHLPKMLSAAGIEYTLIDDTQLKSTGYAEEGLGGYYITDFHESSVKIFPVNNLLNQIIPFSTPEECIESIKNASKRNKSKLVVVADAGEKYGCIPGSKKWIFEDKWLEKYLELLKQNKNIIRTTTFTDFIEENAPSGKLYIPSSSRQELASMSLPIERKTSYKKVASEVKSFGKHDEYKEFLKEGGYFKNFFVKYPEGNNIYNKMLYLSQKAEALEKGRTLGFSSKERDEKINEIKISLFKGQCGSNYFHNTENRIYLPEMREGLIRELLKAEVLIDRLGRGEKKFIEVKSVDFDKNGLDEILVSSNLMNCYITPSIGGSIFEIDHKMKNVNILNVFTRYFEMHHNDINEKDIVYDDQRRMSLLDHFFATDASFDMYKSSSHEELGDFIKNPYMVNVKTSSNEVNIKLSRKGLVNCNNENLPIEITKTINILAGQTQANIEYEVINTSNSTMEALFGVEFNFLMNADQRSGNYLFENKTKASLRSFGEANNVGMVKLIDESRDISVSLETSDSGSIWRYPIETVSWNEGLLDSRFQGSSILLNKKLKLNSGDKWKNNIRLSLE